MRAQLCVIAVLATDTAGRANVKKEKVHVDHSRGPTDLPANAGRRVAVTALPDLSAELEGMNTFLDGKINEAYEKFREVQEMIPYAVLGLSKTEVADWKKAVSVKSYDKGKNPVTMFLYQTTVDPRNHPRGTPVQFTDVASELKAVNGWGGNFMKGAHAGLEAMAGRAVEFNKLPQEFDPTKLAEAGPPKGVEKDAWLKTLAARRVKAVGIRLQEGIVATSAEVSDEIEASKKTAYVPQKCPDEEDFCAETAFASTEEQLKRIAEAGAYVAKKFMPNRLVGGVALRDLALSVPLATKETFALQQYAIYRAMNETQRSLDQLWRQGDVPSSFLGASRSKITEAFGKVMGQSIKFHMATESSVKRLEQGLMPDYNQVLKAYGRFCDTVAQSMDDIRAGFGLDEVGGNDQVMTQVTGYLKASSDFAAKEYAKATAPTASASTKEWLHAAMRITSHQNYTEGRILAQRKAAEEAKKKQEATVTASGHVEKDHGNLSIEKAGHDNRWKKWASTTIKNGARTLTTFHGTPLQNARFLVNYEKAKRSGVMPPWLLARENPSLLEVDDHGAESGSEESKEDLATSKKKKLHDILSGSPEDSPDKAAAEDSEDITSM